MLEMLIRRIDNRIYFFDRDIALHDLQHLTCWKDMFKENRVHENILPP
jgi:hypothetical protein